MSLLCQSSFSMGKCKMEKLPQTGLPPKTREAQEDEKWLGGGEDFFSIIREAFFLSHISFSPSAFADSIPHLGHSKRRGKISLVIAAG